MKNLILVVFTTYLIYLLTYLLTYLLGHSVTRSGPTDVQSVCNNCRGMYLFAEYVSLSFLYKFSTSLGLCIYVLNVVVALLRLLCSKRTTKPVFLY